MSDESGPQDADDEEGGSPTFDRDLREAFHRSVAEGRARLDRTWSNLVATGLVGGFDVGLGVLALVVIESATGSRLLGAFGFTIGFIALALGKSELFTENFLVPVAAVVGGHAPVRKLWRLWGVTCLTNIVAGWLIAFLIAASLPRLTKTAIEAGRFYANLTSYEALILGVIAGMVITLMTWMQHGARSEGGGLVAVSSAAFLLAAAPLNHIIVVSIILFSGIHAGAPYGYADWARVAGIAGLANLVGGVLLVTALRLVQVGPATIREERARADRRP